MAFGQWGLIDLWPIMFICSLFFIQCSISVFTGKKHILKISKIIRPYRLVIDFSQSICISLEKDETFAFMDFTACVEGTNWEVPCGLWSCWSFIHYFDAVLFCLYFSMNTGAETVGTTSKPACGVALPNCVCLWTVVMGFQAKSWFLTLNLK